MEIFSQASSPPASKKNGYTYINDSSWKWALSPHSLIISAQFLCCSGPRERESSPCIFILFPACIFLSFLCLLLLLVCTGAQMKGRLQTVFTAYSVELSFAMECLLLFRVCMESLQRSLAEGQDENSRVEGRKKYILVCMHALALFLCILGALKIRWEGRVHVRAMYISLLVLKLSFRPSAFSWHCVCWWILFCFITFFPTKLEISVLVGSQRGGNRTHPPTIRDDV